MNPELSIPMNRLAEYCRARGIARLAIFGSTLRSDFGPASDIDLLVEFESGRTPGLLGIVGMEQEFSDLFERNVDLVERPAVEQSRNYIRRTAILESAETIYAA